MAVARSPKVAAGKVATGMLAKMALGWPAEDMSTGLLAKMAPGWPAEEMSTGLLGAVSRHRLAQVGNTQHAGAPLSNNTGTSTALGTGAVSMYHRLAQVGIIQTT